MIPLRPLLVVATAFALVVVVSGASGGGSMHADRPFYVATVDDERAYLGVQQASSGTVAGRTNLSVTIVNQFQSDTVLRWVRIRAGGETAVPVDGDPLAPGERASARFTTVDCRSRILIDVEGPEFEGRLERRVACARVDGTR